MLKDYLTYSKLVLVFVILYPFFTLVNVCPVLEDLSHVDVNSLQPVAYYVCVAGNKILHPVVANHIIPNYVLYVKPQIIKIDDSIRHNEKVIKLKSNYNTFEQKLGIHRTVNIILEKVLELNSKLNYNYFVYVHPTISKGWNLFKLKSQYYARLGLIRVNYSFKIAVYKIQIVFKRSCDYLSFKLGQWFDKVRAIEFIANIIYWWDQMVDKLVFKAQDYALYEKKEFLKAEFKNLSRFNQFYKFNSSINLAELANNLLHDAQQKVVSVGEKFKGEKSAFEQEMEREKEIEHEEEIEEESENEIFEDAIEDLDKNADVLDPIEGDFTQIIEGEYLEVVDEEFDTPETANIPEEIPPVSITNNATEIFDSDESEDEGPLTIKIVSTITVTEEAETTDGISVDNVSDGIKQINEELIDWEIKVNNTIKLAANNLEFEMQPKISEILEVVKPTVNEKLTQLQTENYQNYQNLNKKILEINRDYEKIYTSNDTTIETVSRQEIRDDIALAYKLDGDVVEEVQLSLIVNHESVLKEYFAILQDTIDILESFSETAVNDYTKRFTQTLENVAVDDEMLWNSWKQFYKIKDGIFDFRNHIFDVANQYKTRDLKSIYTAEIIGLGAWNEYINDINFHIKFITHDNDEYMKLIRAQANIAFQLREGLVIEIERREKEQQEQQEAKRVEEEKLAEMKQQILIEELRQQARFELEKNEGVSTYVTLSEAEGVSSTVEPIENIKTEDNASETLQAEVEDSDVETETLQAEGDDSDIEIEIVEEIVEEIDTDIEDDDNDSSSTGETSTKIVTTTSTSVSIVHESIDQTNEDYEDHLSDDEKTDDEI